MEDIQLEIDRFNKEFRQFYDNYEIRMGSKGWYLLIHEDIPDLNLETYRLLTKMINYKKIDD